MKEKRKTRTDPHPRIGRVESDDPRCLGMLRMPGRRGVALHLTSKDSCRSSETPTFLSRTLWPSSIYPKVNRPTIFPKKSHPARSARIHGIPWGNVLSACTSMYRAARSRRSLRLGPPIPRVFPVSPRHHSPIRRPVLVRQRRYSPSWQDCANTGLNPVNETSKLFRFLAEFRDSVYAYAFHLHRICAHKSGCLQGLRTPPTGRG